MLLQTLTFNGNVNVSLQPGDIIYYSSTTTIAGSGVNSVNTPSSVVTFGVCTDIYNNGSTSTVPIVPPNSIIVSYDETNPATPLPSTGDYIMFSKNKEVNSSSVKGYYAEVTLTNNSTDKIELFSVSSQVSESSK